MIMQGIYELKPLTHDHKLSERVSNNDTIYG